MLPLTMRPGGSSGHRFAAPRFSGQSQGLLTVQRKRHPFQRMHHPAQGKEMDL
jgi:hypothetical protein